MEHSRRVALITGAAKRVGRAIALKLAREQFDIVFTYLSSSAEAEALVEELTGLGATAFCIKADLTAPLEAVEAIVSEVEVGLGRLDVLVNNASLYQGGDLRDTNLELIRRFNAIHVEAPLLLAQRFEAMLRTSHGHIVNMVDLLAQRPWPAYLAYCASKAALANLTLGLARELAPDVTVNGIAPGVVEWPQDYPQADREKYLKRVPLHRAGTPEDVANLVHYLVTDGSYITGQIIPLDGGRSIT